MIITQAELNDLLKAEEYAKVHRLNIKSRMIAKEQVEVGPMTAKISAQTKRTPDYQGFILSAYGPEKIYELKNSAVPVEYVKLDIFPTNKVRKYVNK